MFKYKWELSNLLSHSSWRNEKNIKKMLNDEKHYCDSNEFIKNWTMYIIYIWDQKIADFLMRAWIDLLLIRFPIINDLQAKLDLIFHVIEAKREENKLKTDFYSNRWNVFVNSLNIDQQRIFERIYKLN